MSELKMTNAEHLVFSAAVAVKLLELGALLRRHNARPESVLPHSLRSDFQAMRNMHERFKGDDHRCTEQETAAQQRIASWMIRTWHHFHETTPPENPWTE